MKSIPVFILVALFASLYALAEEDESFSLGISAGWNRSAHNFVKPDLYPCNGSGCRPFIGENGDGFSGGLSFDLPLTYGNWGISFTGRLNYEKMEMYSLATRKEPYRIKIDSIKERIGYVSIHDDLKLTDHILILDILFRMNLSDSKLGIILGPSLCFTISSNILYQAAIIEPENVSFVPSNIYGDVIYRDNNRTIVGYDAELPEINRFRIAASFGMNYNLDIPSISTRIVPWFMYYFDLTQLRKDWEVSAVRTGVDIRYMF